MLDAPVATKKSTGEAPTIIEDLKQVIGVSGGSATLTCKISGRPMPDVIWMRFVVVCFCGRYRTDLGILPAHEKWLGI